MIQNEHTICIDKMMTTDKIKEESAFYKSLCKHKTRAFFIRIINFLHILTFIHNCGVSVSLGRSFGGGSAQLR